MTSRLTERKSVRTGSAESVNQAFQIFLPAGARLGLQVSFVNIGGEFLETLLACQDRAAEIAVATGIAFENMTLKGAILNQGGDGGIEKSAGDRVHRSDDDAKAIAKVNI